jgi:hypothetical protein
VSRSIISVVLGSIWRPLGERPNYWSSFIQEGASQIRVLCIWWVRTSFFILRLHQGFDIDPIYSLAYSSEGLVAFGSKAELLRVFSVPAGRGLSSWGFGTSYVIILIKVPDLTCPKFRVQKSSQPLWPLFFFFFFITAFPYPPWGIVIR